MTVVSTRKECTLNAHKRYQKVLGSAWSWSMLLAAEERKRLGLGGGRFLSRRATIVGVKESGGTGGVAPNGCALGL